MFCFVFLHLKKKLNKKTEEFIHSFKSLSGIISSFLRSLSGYALLGKTKQVFVSSEFFFLGGGGYHQPLLQSVNISPMPSTELNRDV